MTPVKGRRRIVFKDMTAEQRLQVARDAAKGPVERAEPYQISGLTSLPKDWDHQWGVHEWARRSGRKLNPRINSASEAEQRKADELLAALEYTGALGLRRRCFVNGIPYNDVAPLERTTLIERLFEHRMGYPLFELADEESVA